MVECRSPRPSHWSGRATRVRGVVQFLPRPPEAQNDACGLGWIGERAVDAGEAVESNHESLGMANVHPKSDFRQYAKLRKRIRQVLWFIWWFGIVGLVVGELVDWQFPMPQIALSSSLIVFPLCVFLKLCTMQIAEFRCPQCGELFGRPKEKNGAYRCKSCHTEFSAKPEEHFKHPM